MSHEQNYHQKRFHNLKQRIMFVETFQKPENTLFCRNLLFIDYSDRKGEIVRHKNHNCQQVVTQSQAPLSYTRPHDCPRAKKWSTFSMLTNRSKICTYTASCTLASWTTGSARSRSSTLYINYFPTEKHDASFGGTDFTIILLCEFWQDRDPYCSYLNRTQIAQYEMYFGEKKLVGKSSNMIKVRYSTIKISCNNVLGSPCDHIAANFMNTLKQGGSSRWGIVSVAQRLAYMQSKWSSILLHLLQAPHTEGVLTATNSDIIYMSTVVAELSRFSEFARAWPRVRRCSLHNLRNASVRMFKWRRAV